ncbi:hypothetical protein [Mycobacterium sp. 852002-51961_SCH5331710]|uniref:hypothetical protein n=1 Tax=Mycobacterium sp. 852002-51961_SCH5331710 TaxID=1834105 RepID=UPI0007FBFAAF|nr:hypothetical protein [Mycobacterium sp. 852002-51961_SCH5331710]OBB35707.1 hypothetical protein A5752_19210 [Mycobacterium sp. 852002-51961_SCH5331710]
MAQQTSEPPVIGALWMWFAAIGGAAAWAVHLASSWGLTETSCLSGHSTILGHTLKSVVTLTTVIPGLVCLAALLAAWWMRRETRRLDNSTDRAGRAYLVAGVALWSNMLFLAIIVFDGIALLVFPSCLM